MIIQAIKINLNQWNIYINNVSIYNRYTSYRLKLHTSGSQSLGLKQFS